MLPQETPADYLLATGVWRPAKAGLGWQPAVDLAGLALVTGEADLKKVRDGRAPGAQADLRLLQRRSRDRRHEDAVVR